MSILDFRMSGRYHSPGIISGPITTCALTIDRLYAVPFYCGPARSFDRIGYRVTTYKAGAKTRLGIYLDNDSIYPGTLVKESAELDGNVNQFWEDTIDWTSVVGKLYWLSLITNQTISVRAMTMGYGVCSMFGRLAATDNTQESYLYVARAYGAFPATFPNSPTYNSTLAIPAVFLRSV